jgi:hypothetical protein
MSAADVWIAKDDGSDLVRADAIVGVGRDYNGNITVRLSGCEHAVVTLVAESGHHGTHTPDEYHRQLLRVIAQLSHTAEAAVVRPAHDEANGWTWHVGPL